MSVSGSSQSSDATPPSPGQHMPASATPTGPYPGRVALVGAGPGDPELLTCKAARLIAEADWLVHDALVQPAVIAMARRARIIPVGKRAGNPSARQSTINQTLLDCARQGGLTVRLKGGDPLIFARAQEELDTLHAAGIAVEVVPGISTAQAAHAALAMPMTQRGHRRAMVLATPQVHAGQAPCNKPPEARASAHLPYLKGWAAAVAAAGSGSLYMAATIAEQVREILLEHGMPPETPALWMVDVSLPTQAVVRGTLGTLSRPPADYAGHPALLILGAQPADPAQA